MTKRLSLRRGAPLTKGFHTKASLARTACELLGRNGFHRTGLNELIAASGAPRGSLYYHFPGGKAEIVAAGLEIARAHTASLLRDAFAGEKPLQEKVGALFEQLASTRFDPSTVQEHFRDLAEHNRKRLAGDLPGAEGGDGSAGVDDLDDVRRCAAQCSRSEEPISL